MTIELPTERTKPVSDLAKQTILLYGPPKFGKCLSGQTVLCDPHTGRPRRLEEIVRRAQDSVITLCPGGRLRAVKPSAYIENEPAEVFRVTTDSGRTIQATVEHPFLTTTGWKRLRDLTSQDRVAVIAEYPWPLGKRIASPQQDRQLARFVESAALAVRSQEEGVEPVNVATRVPACAFELRPVELECFLGRLLAAIAEPARYGVRVRLDAPEFLGQLQHLLARVGIFAVVEDGWSAVCEGSATLSVTGRRDLRRLVSLLGLTGCAAATKRQLRSCLQKRRGCAESHDRAGPLVYDYVKNIEFVAVEPVYDLTIPDTHNFVANDFVVHNSTFASKFPEAIFFECEPGLAQLEVFKAPTLTWPDFLEACRLVAAGNHRFKTIVVDTVDNAFRACTEFVCAKHNIEYEGDLPHGKGWALIKNEWHRVLTRLAALPYGLVLISHAVDKTIETRTGEYTKTQPSLPDRARAVVMGLADMILFGDMVPRKDAAGNVTAERVLRTKPHHNYEAGDRSGRLPDVLPLDYEAFVRAFATSAPAVFTGAGAATPVSPTATSAVPSPAAAPVNPPTPAAKPAATSAPPQTNRPSSVSSSSTGKGAR